MILARMRIWNSPPAATIREDNRQLESNSRPSSQGNLRSVSATFEARDVYGAKLYWEDQLWEELVPNRPIKVNTFAGHRWHVRLELDEAAVMSWTIQYHPSSQRFVFTAQDLPIYTF
jgi:hypothetical protein